MAYRLVSNVKDSISGILTGLNLNNVQNLNGALERTARELCTRIYIPTVQGKTAITLYDGVFDYPISASPNIFGAGVVDFRPQGVSRQTTDFVFKQPLEVFDRMKQWFTDGYHLTFEFVQGVARLRVVSSRPLPRIELDPFTIASGWTAGGSAGTPSDDKTVFWHLPSATRFTLTGASTGILTKTIPQVDLTDYVGVGMVFIAFRTPSATNLTSFSIKLGSTSGLATDYYQVSSVTTGFLGAFTANEWLLVALDLANATTTGSPDKTKIKYAQISIAHAATLTNFYIGDFWISLPSPHDILYQTSGFFLASGGSPSQTITNNNDSVILNDAALVIYEYESAKTIAEQQGGTLANGLVGGINEKLYGAGRILGLYDIYRGANPSQELRQISNYYND